MAVESNYCRSILGNGSDSNAGSGLSSNVEMYAVYILFVGMVIFVIAVAKFFTFIRTSVHKDKDNLDTNFDAGGKVSMGLTATTIVSQWTWAATLLQSSTVASKYGISGPFWYAAGATIQILLFSMLSVQLKIRAPGAKTFLQVIRARFGAKTHITFCVFALMTNVIVTAMLMLGGAAVMTNLVSGLSIELATGLVAAVIGSYTFIGGLGATFYVSYFNTALIYIIMLIFLSKVYHDSDSPDNPLGSIERVFDYLRCSEAPDGNEDNSFLTMVSEPGLMFGVINIVGNFGTVFVDQSYWQSSVAAKPKQGVWGFLCGGLVWFAAPFTFATTMGLAYIALSAKEGAPLLTDDDVDAGLVPPIVAQRMFGSSGEFLVLLMILMAVTSTGSAEIIAVTSILVYDIYRVYLKPYRLVHDANSCILCGKQRGRFANPRDKCACISMTHCAACSLDDEQRQACKRAIKPDYKCKVHGSYRVYNNYLQRLKNWVLLWATLAIIPLTIILEILEISLGWVYLFMGVVIGSAVVPIALSMFWSRLSGCAMMIGSISGCFIGLIVWLSVAASRPGGLNNFFDNTGAEVSMLCGNLTSILSGGLLTVVVSYIKNWKQTPEVRREVWENTRDIDNPLSPWTELYARDLNLSGANQLDNRPSLEDVSRAFRSARIVANVGALSLTFLLIFLWPSAMTGVGVMDLTQFTHWVRVSQSWTILATIFIIVVPVLSEVLDIRVALREKNNVGNHHLFPEKGHSQPGSARSVDPSNNVSNYKQSSFPAVISIYQKPSSSSTSSANKVPPPGSRSSLHDPTPSDSDPREPIF